MRRFVLVDDEPARRDILIEELRHALRWELAYCGTDEAQNCVEDSVLLALTSEETHLRSLVPPEAEIVVLKVRSVPASLNPYLPFRSRFLTVIASAWPQFLDVARTVLSAAGWEDDSLEFRNASDPDWLNGVGSGTAVVCDALTSNSVPANALKIVFPLVAESSIAQLRSFESFYDESA